MLPRIGLTEIVIVCVLLVLFLGAKRIPEFGKGLGEAKNAFKSGYKEDNAAQPTKKK